MSSAPPSRDPFGPNLIAGTLCVRPARDAGDLAAGLELRARAFGRVGPDRDSHDAQALHLMGWVGAWPGAVLRLMLHADGDSLRAGYTGGLYDLAGVARLPGPTLEMGRLCLAPQTHNPDLVRLLLAGVARVAARTGAARLLGCVSFPGADPDRHAAALAFLGARHLGPPDQRPQRPVGETGPAAAQTVDLPKGPGDPAGLPPALRFYLSLGAWVSGHATLDHDLDTLHVLCVLDIAAMSPARKRALMALAGSDAEGTPSPPLDPPTGAS